MSLAHHQAWTVPQLWGGSECLTIAFFTGSCHRQSLLLAQLPKLKKGMRENNSVAVILETQLISFEVVNIT